MKPERAREIIQQAKDRATIGPWSDQLQHVMTLDERRDLITVWKTMPGSSCFVDVLNRAAREQ